MATLGVDDINLQADWQPYSFGLVWGLVAGLHSLNEPSELSQWHWHDDSTALYEYWLLLLLYGALCHMNSTHVVGIL